MSHNSHDQKAQQATVQVVAGGQLRLFRRLGQSGTGDVFLGDWGGRQVAVKRLQTQWLAAVGDRDKFLERFRREATAGISVRHSSLVPLYALIEHEGELFLIMEYVMGRTLRAIMQERIPFHRVLLWSCDMVEGLYALHKAGIVHRDLKPDHVLIDGRDLRARLLDYGLVRVRDGRAMKSLAETMGTPGYMAPEQACGERVDARADMFALGAVIYELVSGYNPFAGTGPMATVENMLSKKHTPLSVMAPQVPAELTELVDWLLKKEPADRPSDWRQVLRVLKGIQFAGHPVFQVGRDIRQPDCQRDAGSPHHADKTVPMRRP